MKHLASAEETQTYGSLGNKFDCDEMMSQCKVMYDNINPKIEGTDDKDTIRLHEIKSELIQTILSLEKIIKLN